MTGFSRIHRGFKAALSGISILALTACSPEFQLPFGTPDETPELSTRSAQSDATGLEVEAPDLYFAEETGLWDGRPSLGGVWVAHPDATDPLRVLVTNEANGQTVVGALFRRERDNFGPPFMISSDAAAALNVVAGSPTELTVVALRRNEIPQELDLATPPPEPVADADSDATALPETIAATSLEPVTTPDVTPASTATPVAAAAPEVPSPEMTASAINVATLAENAIALAGGNAAETQAETPAETAEPVTQVAAASPAPAESLTRPYIQIGIYAVEANALGAADDMRGGGVVPTVLNQSNAERNLWRVIVGPARNSEERAALLETIRGLGYEDAYYVTN